MEVKLDQPETLFQKERVRFVFEIYDEAISTRQRSVIVFATAILIKVLKQEGYIDKSRYPIGVGDKLSKILVKWKEFLDNNKTDEDDKI